MPSNPTMPAFEPLMTETDAARQFSVSIRTLQQWRVAGGGPRYIKIGRCVRYTATDLADYVAAGRRAHTSERAR